VIVRWRLSDEEVRTSQVPMVLHGQRLDRALAQMVPEFSRSYLQQLIEQGDALIDGRVVTKVSTKVRLGHRVEVTLRATPQSQAFVPEEMPIDVVYEDTHAVFANRSCNDRAACFANNSSSEC